MTQSRVPEQLRAGILAVLALTGAGGGAYLVADRRASEMQRHEYVQAVAADDTVGLDIKIAMVMAAYYESSYKHIGTPYVDKLGKGRPLTVCAGITGAGVVAGKEYSPADCYRLEKGRYMGYQQWLRRDLPMWDALPVFVRATVADFMHNKGAFAFAGSTMRKKLMVGDLVGACMENPKWNRGTVNGVSTVLPGLKVRGEANAEICLWDAPMAPEPVLPPPPPMIVASAPEVVPPAPAVEAPKLPWWRRIFTRGAA